MCAYRAPQPAPTAAEKELAQLKEYARQRAEFGFRSDLAYVRKLVKAGRYEYDVGYIPVTKREDDYLKLRDRLQIGDAGYRYIRPIRDFYGGISVEDDWPREPYLLIRFTRNVEGYLAGLKRVARFPDNLRAKRVRFSERELDRLRDRVHEDSRRLRKAGFHIQGSSYDTDKGVAEIELVTKRTDAKTYFRKRYGARVKPIVTDTETTALECGNPTSYRIAPDGGSIVVRYETGGGAVYERTELVEHADRIEIGIVERAPTGFRTADLQIRDAPATALSAPLGTRAVIDMRTGRRVAQSGPSPGDPPCPGPAEPAPPPSLGPNAYELEDDDKVDAYVRKHYADFGGSDLQGTAAAPYMVYGFVKDAARHERAIQRLTRHRGKVRVMAVQFRASELEALARRIGEDALAGDGFLDGYGRAGFAVADANPDWQAVAVRLYTTRQDHAAWFAARYGPAVRTEVIGDRYECAMPE
ncbi:hypothetical protein DVA67_027220 [Solirubrobacter sp. CPCC 204708]|uniref:POTRA domain-containing protein n=1 Tax=Solirubrobacter deserti TaxID=2282478 RepID=A0ABT4RGS2_9ACTN|nr:hypothetical protein [Solirubrobacter deserti]MBE2319690.1 hypothetical protein [Solirubrobacter deserti]MDA0137571.1 hypothetical protein [Solirubrobacter deserti]